VCGAPARRGLTRGARRGQLKARKQALKMSVRSVGSRGSGGGGGGAVALSDSDGSNDEELGDLLGGGATSRRVLPV
jgi:hypothetical protein